MFMILSVTGPIIISISCSDCQDVSNFVSQPRLNNNGYGTKPSFIDIVVDQHNVYLDCDYKKNYIVLLKDEHE